MRRSLAPFLIVLSLLAVACGDDDAATDAGAEPGDTPPPGDDPPVDDAPLGAGPYPIADLVFTISPDGADDSAFTYRLACLGDTATMTGESSTLDERSACLALNDEAVRTRLLVGPPADQMCTEQYGGPQLAGITGTLDGETVDAVVGRANGCGINDYDIVLAPLLPPPGNA
jgi:hypothetical protein